MGYSVRFNGHRWRHDPACQGIFIHGGSSFWARTGMRPNRFTITVPSIHREEGRALMSSTVGTFQQAVTLVKVWQKEHLAFHHMPVFACTDFLPTGPYSATYYVQRIF